MNAERRCADDYRYRFAADDREAASAAATGARSGRRGTACLHGLTEDGRDCDPAGEGVVLPRWKSPDVDRGLGSAGKFDRP